MKTTQQLATEMSDQMRQHGELLISASVACETDEVATHKIRAEILALTSSLLTSARTMQQIMRESARMGK
jgi:hypothetical protein